MRFRCYGLILSLSLLIPAGLAFGLVKDVPQDMNETQAAEENQQQPDAQPAVQPAEPENQANEAAENNAQKQQVQVAEQEAQPKPSEEITKKVDSLDAQYQNLSTSMDSQSTQIIELKQQQEQILQAIQESKNSNSDVVQSSAVYNEQVEKLMQEQEKITASINALAETLDKLKTDLGKVSQQDNKPEIFASTYPITGRNSIKPSNVTIEQRDGQQYLKVKFVEDGQEFEMFLDPTYVDMDLDFKKSKQDQQSSGQDKAINNPELQRVMDYVSRSMDSRSSGIMDQSGAGYAPAQPMIPQPQQGMSQPAEQRQEQPQLSPQENTQVLEPLYKAQKLFYKKRYNAALNSVQKSLSVQPTALAYALEGSIYFTLGDVDLAISSWEAALRLDPNMTEVKRALFKYKR